MEHIFAAKNVNFRVRREFPLSTHWRRSPFGARRNPWALLRRSIGDGACITYVTDGAVIATVELAASRASSVRCMTVRLMLISSWAGAQR
jgi:hypothetical protein